MKQLRKSKQHESAAETGSAPSVDTDAIAAAEKHGEELKDEMDAVLDEIDDVLEKNAAEFVKSYVQKGGQ